MRYDKGIQHVHLDLTQLPEWIKPNNQLMCFFGYGRFYKNGHYLLASNNQPLYQHFFEKKYPLVCPISKEYIVGHQFYYLVQDDEQYHQAIHDVRSHFNLYHAVNIVKIYSECFDFFCFGTDDRNPVVFNSYINQLESLWNFTNYCQTFLLTDLEKSRENQVKLPQSMRSNDLFSTTFGKGQKIDQELKRVTAREFECLHYLSKGFSSPRIAAHMKISIRTVEGYIEELKSVFDIKYKQDFIGILSKSVKDKLSIKIT